MICPRCKAEYREGYTECSDCGVDLVEAPQVAAEQKGGFFNSFGRISAQKAITALFYLSIVPYIIAAVFFGKFLYMTNTYLRDIPYMEGAAQNAADNSPLSALRVTQVTVNNLPLAIIGGILFFIFSVLIWKAVCELLVILFRCLETYIRKNANT